jgi:hypothetical protein
LQRDSEVASAVLSNPCTRICFRLGDDDARKLSDGFAFFETRDLQNLSTGEAICRIERSDFDFNLTVPLLPEPVETVAALRREEVITASRRKYATPRADVEAALRKVWQIETPPEKAVPKREVIPEKPPIPPLEPPRPVVTTPIPAPEPPKPLVLPAPPPPAPEPAAPEIKSQRVSERKAPAPPADLGRGGAQHQAIQGRIKQAAEALGFRGVIEKEVLGGQGSVDLFLERASHCIACEISISTTIDHEVGNVAKCLKAGITKVAVICLNDERLRRIEAAVTGGLGAEVAGQVEYFQPDQFIVHLRSLQSPAATSPAAPEKRRGYTIKRSAATLSLEEQKQREDAAIRSIATAMRKETD